MEKNILTMLGPNSLWIRNDVKTETHVSKPILTTVYKSLALLYLTIVVWFGIMQAIIFLIDFKKCKQSRKTEPENNDGNFLRDPIQ